MPRRQDVKSKFATPLGLGLEVDLVTRELGVRLRERDLSLRGSAMSSVYKGKIHSYLPCARRGTPEPPMISLTSVNQARYRTLAV